MYQKSSNKNRYDFVSVKIKAYTNLFNLYDIHTEIKILIYNVGRDDLTEAEVYDITLQCLKRSQHLPRKGIHYETPSNYEPFAVNMGQMTVYRFRIRCKVIIKITITIKFFL